MGSIEYGSLNRGRYIRAILYIPIQEDPWFLFNTSNDEGGAEGFDRAELVTAIGTDHLIIELIYIRCLMAEIIGK